MGAERDVIIHLVNHGEPEKMIWHAMYLVKISDVPGFAQWLGGQTLPLVEDAENPCDWAYYDDYIRFIEHMPIID